MLVETKPRKLGRPKKTETKRKPGRPRKEPLVDPVEPKRRGRPKKVQSDDLQVLPPKVNSNPVVIPSCSKATNQIEIPRQSTKSKVKFKPQSTKWTTENPKSIQRLKAPNSTPTSISESQKRGSPGSVGYSMEELTTAREVNLRSKSTTPTRTRKPTPKNLENSRNNSQEVKGKGAKKLQFGATSQIGYRKTNSSDKDLYKVPTKPQCARKRMVPVSKNTKSRSEPDTSEDEARAVYRDSDVESSSFEESDNQSRFKKKPNKWTSEEEEERVSRDPVKISIGSHIVTDSDTFSDYSYRRYL